MFSSILKIIPKLDAAALKAMEKSLSGRFKKIANGFGKGLAAALKGGSLAGIGIALVDKLLNPLKETQEAIDRMLKSSDDIATNARQFNTTTGKLYKLVGLGEATGLDQDSLFMLINKFQNAVADAEADPTKNSAVRQYVGDKDSAESFFNFIQSLQGMDKNSQLRAQSEVFGEKQILKMADFLQSNFKELYKDVGFDKVGTEKLTGAIDKAAGLNDRADVLGVKRRTVDTVTKGNLITNGMINARDASERLALQRENQNIGNYSNLQALAQTGEKINIKIEELTSKLGEYLPKVTNAIDNGVKQIDKLVKSPTMRGILEMFTSKGK